MTTPPDPGQPAGSEGAERPASGYAVPVAKPAKARLLQDGRDMFWSIGPLIIACVVLAGVLGRCSFAPTGPGEGPPAHPAGAQSCPRGLLGGYVHTVR